MHSPITDVKEHWISVDHALWSEYSRFVCLVLFDASFEPVFTDLVHWRDCILS